jgi:hypothetical protein
VSGPTLRILWVLVVVLVARGALTAQSEYLTWRVRNERPNRFEGVGRPSYIQSAPVLIGFFRFIEGYTAGRGIHLKVLFYATDPARVTLQAQEILPQHSYFMEAKPPVRTGWRQGWNEFTNWPVDDVLGRNRIDARNLGVVIRMDNRQDGTAMVTPAILYHSTAPTDPREYKAYFSPHVLLSSVRFLVTRGCSLGAPVIDQGQLGRQYARIAFPVIFTLPSNSRGEFKLRLEITQRGDSSRQRGEPSQGAPASVYEYCFPHAPIDGLKAQGLGGASR